MCSAQAQLPPSPEHAHIRTQSNTAGGGIHQAANGQYTLKEAIVASIILHLLMFSAAGVEDIHGQCSPLYCYANISTLETPTSAISLVFYFSIYHVARGKTASPSFLFGHGCVHSSCRLCPDSVCRRCGPEQVVFTPIK